MTEEANWPELVLIFVFYLSTIPFIVGLAMNPNPHVELQIEASLLIMGVWALPGVMLGSLLVRDVRRFRGVRET